MKRTQIAFFVLGGFFITNAVLAELIGGKLFTSEMPAFLSHILSWIGIEANQFTMSVGILPWPIVFVATDLVNEFFGRRGVRFYTFVTVGLIIYSFAVIVLARWVTAASFSPVSQEAFDSVFGTSQWIIVGSIIAFLASQLIDVLVFSSIRRRSGERYLWARATGSTVISQLIDTFLIQFVAFVLPGILFASSRSISFSQYLEVATISYIYKVGVAVASTPICYLGHGLIKSYIGSEESEKLIKEAHPDLG